MKTKEFNWREDRSLRNEAETKKQKRRRQIYYRLIASVCLLLAIAAVCSINFFMIDVKASSEQEMITYKYYTSITVKEGETLWDIASTYMSDEFSSMQKYINEVKNINHLRNDKIYAGENLIVPYYSCEYKR